MLSKLRKIIPTDILLIEFVIFVITPHFISQKIFTIFVGGLLILYILFLSYKNNYSKIVIIYLVLLFGIPSQGTKSTGAMTYIIPTSLVLMTIIDFIHKKKCINTIFNFNKAEVLLLFCAFIMNLINGGNTFIFLNSFIIGVVIIRLLFNKHSTNPLFIFDQTRILFFIQFIIVIIERFYGYRAYSSVFDDSLTLESLRCTGYTGHPLVLSSFFIFYSALLLIQSINRNKFYYIDTICLLISCILLASRTSIIIIGLVCIINLLVLMRKKILHTILICMCICVGLSFLLNKSDLGSAFADTTERVSNAGADQRIGAFNITKQIVDKNFWGIGLSSKDRFKSELYKGYIIPNANFNMQFAVIDNSFLTIIISFGYLGLFLFFLYLSPLIRIIKFKKADSLVLSSILGLIFILINFSFETIFYQQIIFIYFLTINNIYGIYDTKYRKKNNSNNYSQLQ